MSKRNYKQELIQQSLKDNVTKLMINKTFIKDINKLHNFRDYYCIFLCKCGSMGKKKPRNILGDNNNIGSGLFCDKCTEKNKIHIPMIEKKILSEDNDVLQLYPIYTFTHFVVELQYD